MAESSITALIKPLDINQDGSIQKRMFMKVRMSLRVQTAPRTVTVAVAVALDAARTILLRSQCAHQYH